MTSLKDLGFQGNKESEDMLNIIESNAREDEKKEKATISNGKSHRTRRLPFNVGKAKFVLGECDYRH